jgi:acylphosphatase
MADERLRARVQGAVQGVGFRYGVIQAAEKLGLKGFVENQPDGSVYVEAEGPSEKLDQLETFLRGGPRPARVEQIESERVEPTGEFGSFSWR